MFVGFYDLEFNPPTFDAVTFALRMEAERIRRNEDYMRIEILPGPWEGFREDSTKHLWPYTPQERRKTLANIVLPIFNLLPKVSRTVVNVIRMEAASPLSFGYSEYMISFKHFVKYAKEIRPLRPAYEFPKNEKLVTITLRECEHWPERNSNLCAWLSAAALIVGMGYEIKIIRDTLIEPLDLEVRAKIYRSAFCNLGVSNGPIWFGVACDAPMLVLKPFVEGGHLMASREYLNSVGLLTDDYRPFKNMWQMVYPKPDTLSNIMEAFHLYREMGC